MNEQICSLIAHQNSLSHMGRNLRGGGGVHGVQELVILVVVLLVVGVGVYLLVRYFNLRDRVSYTSQRGLFTDLCTAHSLDRHEAQMLKQLARQHGLSQPAHLFLAPDRFDPRTVEPSQKFDTKQLTALRDKIFSDKAPVDEVA